MFDFLKDLEYGMDLAATASILIAALSFIWQSAKQRKMSRDSEIWQYFKKVNDDISKFKLKITDVLAKELYYREDGSSVTLKITSLTVSKITNLATKLLFHVQYETKLDIQNILEYYGVKESKKEIIQESIDTAIEKIGIYIECLREMDVIVKRNIDELKGKKLDDLVAKYRDQLVPSDIIDKLVAKDIIDKQEAKDIIDKQEAKYRDELVAKYRDEHELVAKYRDELVAKYRDELGPNGIMDVLVAKDIIDEQEAKVIMNKLVAKHKDELVAKDVIDELVAKGIIDELVAKGIIDELVAKGIIDELAAKGIIDELAAKDVIDELAAKDVIDELAVKGIIDELAAKGIIDELVAKGVIDELAARGIIDELAAKSIIDELVAKGIIVELARITISEGDTEEVTKYKLDKSDPRDINIFYEINNDNVIFDENDNEQIVEAKSSLLALEKLSLRSPLNELGNKLSKEDDLNNPSKEYQVMEAVFKKLLDEHKETFVLLRFRFSNSLVKLLDKFNKNLIQEVRAQEESCLSRVIRKITITKPFRIITKPFRIITKPFRIIADSICK